MSKPIDHCWTAARERDQVRIRGVAERKRNLVPSVRGGISFQLGQTQDHGTFRGCHDYGRIRTGSGS